MPLLTSIIPLSGRGLSGIVIFISGSAINLNEYLKGVWGVPKELCSENEGSLYFARITMFLSLGIH